MRRLNQLTDKDIDKIIIGIQAVIREQLGVDTCLIATATLESVYDELFAESCCFDDVCPLEVLWEVAQHFGLNWENDRWIAWLQLNQNMDDDRWRLEVLGKRTIGDLARFIGRRMKLCRFESVVVLGKTCAPAGAFYGLRDLLDRKKFAPSTPIRTLLNTFEIKQMWSQVQWMSGKSLPDLKQRNPLQLFNLAYWIEALGMVVTVFATIVATLMAAKISLRVFADLPEIGFPAIGLTLLLVTVFGYLCSIQFAELAHNPLPAEIKTFGDLSRLIVSSPDNA